MLRFRVFHALGGLRCGVHSSQQPAPSHSGVRPHHPSVWYFQCSIRSWIGASPRRSLSVWSSLRPAPPTHTVEEVAAEIRSVHEKTLVPLNSRLLGPLEKSSHEMMPLPVVFVLGNHSSGKSTFINYILGREVQASGVAPTNDTYDFITCGSEDTDQDGPALVGDPDLGFSGLRSFGRELINHVNLKVRTGLTLKDIILVDSPGMIDSPTSSVLQGGNWETDSAEAQFAGIRTNMSPRDRGYNFPGVVRWIAERADVILLFFDPDKPGTTGETLACMRAGLSGLDHKVLYILNKADQFERVHDFARAYGSLCWNLSKVIPRKDLPMIYTTCVPTSHRRHSERQQESSSREASMWDASDELESNREQIVSEVKRAPARRVDNLVTRLYDSTRLLRMHAVVLEAVRRDIRSLQWKFGAIGVGIGAVGIGGGISTALMGLVEVGAPLMTLGVGGVAGVWWAGTRAIQERKSFFLDGDARGLDEFFQREHFHSLAEKDDFLLSLWERVKPQLQRSIRSLGITGIPRTRTGTIQQLDAIVNEQIPVLRRSASKAGSFYNPARSPSKQNVTESEETKE